MKNLLIDRLRLLSSLSRGRTGLLLAGVVLLGGLSSRVGAQDLAASNNAIEQMRTAAGGELSVSTSRRSGLASFIATPPGAGIPITDRSAISASDRALSFVDNYGRAFGLRGRGDVSVERIDTDDLGVEHVRMRQVVSGVPVTGGELIVHLRGRSVTAANGKTLDGLEGFGVIPAVASNEAENQVREFARRSLKAPNAVLSAPRLEILNQGLLHGREFPTRLAWFVEVQDFAVREFVWVDATTRTVLLHFSQLADAKNRAIYNANSGSALPGSLVRSEGGGATGDPDTDKAYTYSGVTYDYYFTEHGRDSFDGAGGQLRSSVHYCPSGGPCPYGNAFWNGSQMVYGNGYASADDVVAHELTHAITERTANLFYYMQSGSLNESFSDIFGETVDQGNVEAGDTAGVKWKIAEDLPIGAIRDMMNPTLFGDPGKMSDPQFRCDTYPSEDDSGGVHTNSGIPNHAYALMVDGGAYNGFTVSGIGLTKAAKIQYRALTQYLTSASDFLDNYVALQQACADLVGTAGITTSNCGEVTKALNAVQMSSVWACAPIQATAPALCSAGQHPVNTFLDTFESGLGNWSISGTPGFWFRTSNPSNPLGGAAYATSGVDSMWGYDPSDIAGDARIALASNLPALPTGARLQFNHSYGFDDDGTSNYDGGILEYSTNGGGTWLDAAALFSAGANYGGTIAITGDQNPLEGRSAFVKDTFGFTASQYNLASLAGQTSVRFRFRIGTDNFPQIDDYGWFIDDFRVYQCVADGSPAVTTGAATSVTTNSATLNGTVNPNGFNTTALFDYGLTSSYGTQAYVTPPPGSGVGSVAVSVALSGLSSCTTYHYRTSATNAAATNNGVDATFQTLGCPPPTVTTGAASSVASTGATLNATVNPNGASTSAFFEYGLTASYGSTTSSQALGSGVSGVPLTASITGLTCGTTYHFRATATNITGPTNGSDATFTTICPPTVTTGAASAVGLTGATLNGTVNPNGAATSGSFEYGLTAAYGSTTSLLSLGSGVSGVPLSASITGLTCSTTYHFRAKGTNGGGTVNGLDATFTTSICLPTVTTGAASAIGATGATLNGTVNPNGNSTSGSFEYGLTASYGSTTSPQALGSGVAGVSLTAGVTGLTCGTTYHFRATATNGGGTTVGSDATFTTICPPTVTTGAASAVSATTATLNGTVNPNGNSTSGSFEYGPTVSYGFTTSALALGSGVAGVSLTTGVTGLTCGTTYHFRARATNSGGTTNGSDATFTTICPPTVTTGSANGITLTGATLNGTVNPNGNLTSASFEYGLTTSYGISTSTQALGSGVSGVPITAAISGLSCSTTYHFRATATNGGGTTNGSDSAFTTTVCPGPPPVQWTHVVGVVATGNSLAKTSGTTDWNAGAISLQSLPSGDGSVDFAATETNKDRVVGLGTGDTNQNYPDVEWGIYFTSGGSFLVFEAGVSKNSPAPFTGGDRFSVGVESGVVKYRRNGVLFYSSTVAPTYPLVVDTSLFGIGGTVTDAKLLGFVEPSPTLTINDVSVTEGNSGTVNAVFTVTLAPVSASTVTVVATTANNTAQSGLDYTATGPTTLTFTPGVVTQTFSVPVIGEVVQESNESFFVNLTSPSNAVIGDAQGIGTITNDDLPPAVIWTHVVGVVATGNSLAKTSGTADWNAGAISQQTLPSGDGSFEFTASETNKDRVIGLGTGDTNQNYPDVEWGIYFTSGGSFLVFESGTIKNSAAPFTAGDRFSVGVESGVVKYRRNSVLFYSSTIAPIYPLVVDTSLFGIGATVTDARILGFLEPPPTLTIDDVSVTEGNSGTVNAVFTVTLSPASPSTVTVVATTANNTAQSGLDYTATGPTTLTFTPGVVTQTFSVPVIGEVVQESNESFFVNLTSPSNAVIGDAQGIGTITNDDLPPAVIWTHVVGVVATGNSLAKTSGTSDWNAGAISQQTLPSGDGSFEFTATETNKDRVIGLGTGDTNQNYPDVEWGIYFTSGGSFLVFESGTIKNSAAPFTGGDRFSVGVESGVVKYRRNGVLFYSSTIAPIYPLVVDTSLFGIGATVTDARILGFLEPPPTLTINDVAVTEGNSGTVNAVFTVTLSPASPSTVTVVATTANNTAQSGLDYTATGPTTLTFTPGVVTQTFSVPVIGEVVQESNESFFVNLTSPSNAVIGDAQGIGTITNDDLPPAVIWTHVVGVVATGNSLAKTSGTADWNAGAISQQTLPSGDGSFEFTASETNKDRVIGLGTGDTNQNYPDVEWGIYFTSGGSFLVFESGTIKNSAAPFTAGDRFSVGVESGVVKYRRNSVLFYSSTIAPIYPLVVDTSLFGIGATVTDARILGFLEPPPTLTIDDVSVTEGNSGTVNAVFTVTLSPASPSTVTVVATTANNTAQSGLDYTATGPTTLTFTPGVVTQTFSVPVIGEVVQESNESFFVNLTSPSNAVIGDAQGIGTITNDDLPPAVIWTHVVGVVATGNSLAKTSGTADWNAGAISQQTLPSGDGSFEFTATETNKDRVIGLGTGDTNQNYPDVEWGIYFTSGGSFLVFESGTIKNSAAPFTGGDRFSVGVESGVVKYRRNGVLFYSSTIAPIYPLVVDTSLFGIGATVTDARILGFLEPPPTLTINDVAVTEGNSGTVNAVFTVTLSPASPSTVTVVATTANNTAQSGLDYTATGPTTLTFTPGVVTQTFSVPVFGEVVQESNESFFVNLTSPSNAVIGDAQGVGTITNDDLPPAVIWTHVVGVVATGNSLAKTSGTADWNAGAISQQTLPSGDGSFEFTASETNKDRVIGLGTGDTNQNYPDVEWGIYFTSGGSFLVFESGVTRTSATGFTAGDRFSVGVESGVVKYRRNGVLFYSSTIAPIYPLVVDTSLFGIGATVTDARILGFSEPPPTLTIDDVSVTEGNSGTVNAVFTVTLSPASPSTVTVVATTANNTAQSGLDYTATGPTTLTFAPGVLTQTFSVPVIGETVQESNESFFVNLTGATNAVIGDAQGIGTITNDDLPPAVIWTHVVGVVATGNSLAKTSGTADWNAGAISSQSLSSGDGSFEFTATETNKDRMAGLGTGDANQNYPDIEYAVFLTSGGTFLVFEAGTAKTSAASYTAGDRFSVGVESGVVKYRRNGALFYSSTIAPVYPLVADTSLFGIGATVTDARVTGFFGPPIP